MINWNLCIFLKVNTGNNKHDVVIFMYDIRRAYMYNCSVVTQDNRVESQYNSELFFIVFSYIIRYQSEGFYKIMVDGLYNMICLILLLYM